MDASARKLLAKLSDLERGIRENEQQKVALDQDTAKKREDIKIVKQSLEWAGVRPPVFPDASIVSKKLFAEVTLAEACLTALRGVAGQWLNKSQVEYIVIRGGYNFKAKDPKNSVEITLRRLADDAKSGVKAQRNKGSRANVYCVPKTEQTVTAAD